MKIERDQSIDPAKLLNEAKQSEHKESYILLERKRICGVGVDAEVAPSCQPSFFFEILVYLCSKSSSVDLPLPEKNLVFLKDLKERGYSILCQDNNSISCQKTVTPEDIVAEYEAIKSVMTRTYP